MLLSGPHGGQFAMWAKRVDGELRRRAFARHFDEAAIRDYTGSGQRISDDRATHADPFAAERELRRRGREWEADGWIPTGHGAWEHDERGLACSSANPGVHEITRREFERYCERQAKCRSARLRRYARYEELQQAIAGRRVAEALALLDARAPRTPPDSSFEPALEHAAYLGLLPLVARLARLPWSRDDAAVVAAGAGHLAIVRWLVEERGLDLTARIAPITPLMAAASAGRIEVIDYLIDHGAEPQEQLADRTAEKLARAAGFHAAADRVASRTETSRRALTRRLVQAVREGRAADVTTIVAAGGDPEARSDRGETPLLAAIRRDPGDAPLVAALLGAGADPNRVDADGWTPWLACRAARGDPESGARRAEIETLLLRAGAKKRGASYLALGEAAREGDARRVVALLEEGTWPDAGPARLSPLRAAAARGHGEVVRLLIEAGADVDRREGQGDTALLAAAEAGHLAVVQRLVRAGADVLLFTQREEGCTARHLAQRAGHAAVAEWIARVQEAGKQRLGVRFEKTPGMRLGWQLFARHSGIGNGDFSLVFVEAPIAEVSPVAASFLGGLSFPAIDVRPAEVARSGFYRVYALQLAGAPWTIVVHGMGTLRGLIAEGRELAERLAADLGRRTIHASDYDADESAHFRLFDGGDAKIGTDPAILRRNGIVLPGFDPWDEGGIRLYGATPADLERVDLVAVPEME